MARYDDQFMRHTDALAWNMEHDPGLRSTIVGVTWLDARPDLEVLTARLDRATRIAPRFRQRPVRPPGLFATPRWVDCDLDLSIHLRRIDAPHPHTPRTVIEFARAEAMTEFDPSRPLWAMTLIEGLEGDRAALVLKLHHSLTDGVGCRAARLPAVRADARDGAGGAGGGRRARAGAERAGADPRGTVRSVRSMVSTARGGVGRIVPTAATTVRHPLRSTLDVLATASSLGRFVMPVSDTLSPIMRRRGLGRHLDMIEVEVADLKAAGAAVGSTLNDAFVASVTGGLRRYHALHGASVKDLRVTMPISMRRESDEVGGNRITLERFTVPVGEADPGARVRMTGWLCRAARYEEALPLSDTVAGVLNLLPSGVVGSMLKHVDFVASDVPGVPVDLYLAGAPVTGYYAFGPTTGAALNVTLVSYRGTCCIGVNVDTAAVPDAGVLVDCLRQGFDEVLGVAGEHRPATSPLAESERSSSR